MLNPSKAPVFLTGKSSASRLRATNAEIVLPSQLLHLNVSFLNQHWMGTRLFDIRVAASRERLPHGVLRRSLEDFNEAADARGRMCPVIVK